MGRGGPSLRLTTWGTVAAWASLGHWTGWQREPAMSDYAAMFDSICGIAEGLQALSRERSLHDLAAGMHCCMLRDSV